MIWLRPGMDGRDSMPRLISSVVSPSLEPTADPASALDTIWIPGIGTTQEKLPSGRWMVQEVPFSPNGSTSVAYITFLS